MGNTPGPQGAGGPRTWGTRLERAARRLARRRQQDRRWLRALEPLVERLERRLGPTPDRFRRLVSALPSVPTPPMLEPPDVAQWGDPLTGDIESRLEGMVGKGVERIRVHVGADADSLVRDKDADAVTIGHDVFFREGQYRPHEPEGLALLAHEAVHAVQAGAGDVSQQRATSAGVAAEEHRARSVERRALDPQRRDSPTPLRLIAPRLGDVVTRASAHSRGTEATAAGSGAAPALRPMRAAVDRDTTQPADVARGPNLEDFRRTIYRDLLAQIRAEFERGG